MSGLLEQQRRVWRFFAPHFAHHRRTLLAGSAATLAMVAARLALPWPLMRWAVPALERAEDGAALALEDVAVAGALFAGLFVVIGLADYGVRVAFARFAILVVRDLRSDAARAIGRTGSKTWRARGAEGDFMTRVLGDASRLKEGLKGFLVHVATNGLLFVGAVCVLAFVDLRLAGLLGATFVGVLGATVVGTGLVRRKARKLRKKEGRLAQRIRESAAAPDADAPAVHAAPKRPRAALTRLQSATSVAVHAIYGGGVLACVLVAAGGGASDGLGLLVAYVLILYHPTIRLSRQGTRSGKLFVCARRLEQALRSKTPAQRPAGGAPQPEPAPRP